jgi:Calcineurin-like phosphoesterase
VALVAIRLSTVAPRARAASLWAVRTIRSAAAVALVVIAVLGGGLLALATYSAERDLSVGRIEVSVQPFHTGALDIYVPLVDWGARFSAVRLPARLSIDVRTVNRQAAQRLAEGQLPDVEAVREEARDGVVSYLRELLLLVLLCGLGAGLIVALAVRGHGAPPLRWLFAAAGGTAVAGCFALAVLLPPRGEIADPEYYANGPDIPVALRTIEQAQGSARVISEELNEQLVGLARLVSESSRRQARGLRSFVVASDLHNNLLALPALDRAVGPRPLFFAGDLTSSGSPFEFSLVRRIVRLGHPFVFVSGNHDSDALVRRMALAGGVVLTQRGRLRPDGTHGPVVVRVRGCEWPAMRTRSSGSRASTSARAASRGRTRNSARSSATGSSRSWGVSTSSWCTSRSWPRTRPRSSAARRRDGRWCCSRDTRTCRASRRRRISWS